MSHGMRNILGLAAGCLILVAASAQPASAAQYGAPYRPGASSARVRPNPPPLTRPTVYPPYHGTRPTYNGTRPIGSDWWRIYPWSPYNAWKNPYWYLPYNNNYPFPPDGAYPYDPYLVPRPYPVLPPIPAPPPVPAPSPWGGIGSNYW
jgi:hypothetical protein